MIKSVRTACILMGLCFLSAAGFGQETQTSTIPGALLRPERGEAPRYPRDMVIGELGQGEASDEAYRFARELLSALTTGTEEAQAGTLSLFSEDLVETIRSIRPRQYRLGGGKNEADGSVSFLLRFFGSEESITGELFIKPEMQEKKEDTEGTDEIKEGKWMLDSIIIEERRALSDVRDSYRYDFSPYERFF